MPVPHDADSPTYPPLIETAEASTSRRAAAVEPLSVVTTMRIGASPSSVWESLMLYEELDQRPPVHLRLLLPVPIRTEGKLSEVGARATCVYEDGHIVKRMTRIEEGHVYAFEVIEQKLTVGGGMHLLGGSYTLRESSEGETEVCVETRYVSTRRPRWLWEPIEAAVCHSFHRFLLNAMRRKTESS